MSAIAPPSTERNLNTFSISVDGSEPIRKNTNIITTVKVYPFFEYWYNLNDCEYLLSTPEGEHFKYRNYYDSYWSPLIETLGMKHRPHDTRHTCISMLTVAGVSDKVIKKIVGHKGQGVTEVVYTHFEIEELIDAINKI